MFFHARLTINNLLFLWKILTAEDLIPEKLSFFKRQNNEPSL